jgi:hypothetical protein
MMPAQHLSSRCNDAPARHGTDKIAQGTALSAAPRLALFCRCRARTGPIHATSTWRATWPPQAIRPGEGHQFHEASSLEPFTARVLPECRGIAEPLFRPAGHRIYGTKLKSKRHAFFA